MLLLHVAEADYRSINGAVVERGHQILHRETRPVPAPEDLVVHAKRLVGIEGPQDGGMLRECGCAIGLAVLYEGGEVLTYQCLRLVPEQSRGRWVGEGQP